MEEEINSKSNKLNTATKKIAAAYIRVSTKEQEEKRNSPEEQLRVARDFAESQDFILDDWMIFQEANSAYKIDHKVIDANQYGSISSILSTDRPQLQKLLKSAERGEFTELIVYSRDRLTRNIEESVAIKALFKKLNINIHYSRSGEYSNKEATIYDNFLEIILSSIAELESNVLSSRVTMGSKVNLENGYWNGGKAPFGYSTKQDVRKKQLLTPYYLESSIVQEIFNYYTKYGYGYRKIASIIKEKYSEYNFKIKWNKNTIEWILKNENYTENLVWGRRSNSNSKNQDNTVHRAKKINKEAILIDNTTWNAKCEIMKIKQDTKDRKYFDTPFLLKGKVFCGKCGKKLSCKNYGTGKKSAYRCPTLDGSQSELIIEINTLHQALLDQLHSLFTFNEDFISSIWNLYIIKAKQFEYSKSALLRELENKLTDCKTFHMQLCKIKSNFPKTASKPHLLEEVSDESDEASDEKDNKKSKNNKSNDLPPTRIRSIRETIEDNITTLNKEIDFYEKQLEYVKGKAIPKFDSEKSFGTAIKTFFMNFGDINRTNQRFILDMLINKVTVHKRDGALDLKIVIETARL